MWSTEFDGKGWESDSGRRTGSYMRLLIIDDDENVRSAATGAVEGTAHELVSLPRGPGALPQLEGTPFDIALLDVKDQKGLELLSSFQDSVPQVDWIVLTSKASEETAIEAVQRGARDWLFKPFTAEQLRAVVDRVARARRLAGRVHDLEARLGFEVPPVELTSAEPAMQKTL